MDALYNAFDFLIHPTFWDPNNPPLKVNVNAKIVGLIAAILGGLGILGYLVLIPATLAIGTAVTVLGVNTGAVHPGILIIALLGLLVSLVSDILWTWGGWQMYQENPNGRSMVVVSLALSLIGSIVFNIGNASVLGWVWSLLVTAVIYYFVMIARFPNEAPLSPPVTAPPPPPAPPTA